MFRNYLKIAWRNLGRQKVFAAVNITGMTVAFCAALLLGIAAYHEWSYDQFHGNKNRLFQVYTQERLPDGKVQPMSSEPAPLAPVLQKECPAVEKAVRYAGEMESVQYGETTMSVLVRFVDAPFLSMFNFPVLKGNANALTKADQVLITEKTAHKFFKNGDAIGKILQIKMDHQLRPLMVAGIMADVPNSSSFDFEILASFENILQLHPEMDSWTNESYRVLIQLQKNATAAAFERQARSVIHKYYTDRLKDMVRDGATPDKDGELLSFHTIPLTDIHFNAASNIGNAISRFYPWMLVIMAFMIVSIAAINFINLSMGRSFTRAGEIGLRKALGALRGQLIFQFWSEAFIICSIALVMSLMLAGLLLPGFNALFKYHFALSILKDVRVITGVITIFFFVTLMAGGYPAWLISGFNIVEVLKGKLRLGKSSFMRNALIIIQFIVAVLLISCTVVLWQQLQFLRSRPLGYNQQQVISLPVNGNVNAVQALESLRNRLNGNPHISGVTASGMNLGKGLDGTESNWHVGFDYKGHGVKTAMQEVSYDYVKTLDLKLLAGRDFTKSYADSDVVIISEKMALQLGEKEPIGKFIDWEKGHPMQIIGLIKDFNFKSLHQDIEPLTLKLVPSLQAAYIFVKVQPTDLPGSMAIVEKEWKEINPQGTFQGSFLDDNTNRMYKAESRLASIIISSAVLAIIISCMGLFAVAVLVIAQRNKEIGVRKILGASAASIVKLISVDFLKLVAVAILIASPVAWYLMNTWLQEFAYRIHIQWWTFVLSGMAAVFIAFFTISFQSIRAALMNPVKSLKTE
jgi:putative ABC transport system permease protein